MRPEVSSVQWFGQRDTWPDHAVYVGMPGPAARAYGIEDATAGPFGKPWHLTRDPRGWAVAYGEYLNERIRTDPDFALAVRALNGKTLLCWCRAKAAQRGVPVACHADILAAAVWALN